MKSKDTKKRSEIPPLEDDTLIEVTGGVSGFPDITIPNPDFVDDGNTFTGITRTCIKCGKQFTWSSGSTMLCNKCAPPSTVLTPIEINN